MDEAQVVAQVAQNIQTEDAPVIDEPVQAPEPDSGEVHKTPIYINDPLLEARLTDFFGVGRTEKYSEKTQTQIRSILNWAATETQSKEYADIVDLVYRLERQIGVSMKPNRMALLHRYIVLHHEAQQIQKEMNTLNGGYTL